jgi:hypothetical protein
MLMCVWQEPEYRIDVCRVTHGAYIVHGWHSTVDIIYLLHSVDLLPVWVQTNSEQLHVSFMLAYNKNRVPSHS